MSKSSKKSKQPAPKKQEQSLEERVVQLKRGSYQVHVYLVEGRGLIGDDPESTIDPLVTFTAFGVTKYSTVKDDIGSGAVIYWGEHFFFEKDNLDPVQVEKEKLVIELKNSQRLLNDSLVGRQVFDLAYIYSQEGHALLHQWIGLSNPEADDYSTIHGFIKLGIAVTAEGDRPIDIAAPDYNEDTEMLLPPQITQQTAQLHVRVIKAECLPILDINFILSPDPDFFVSAQFGGAKVQTSVQKANEDEMIVNWYEDLLIPVTLPTVTSRLIVKVFDYDVASHDDIVGSIIFDWNDIVDGKWNDYFWTNIYGAPQAKDNEEAMKMNMNPSLASNWRGRVLLKIWMEETEKPAKKMLAISDPGISQMIREEYEIGEDWELRAQVYSAVAVSQVKEEYKIKISWGDIFLETEEKKTQNGRIDWFTNIKRKVTTIHHGLDRNLPDIFVYLVSDEKNNIAFARLNPAEFCNAHIQPQWIALRCDKALGVIEDEWDGAFVKVRIYIGRLDSANDKRQIGEWHTNPENDTGIKQTVVVNLYQCRDLPPADSDGSADPYVIVYCGGSSTQTDVLAKENTLNPMWYKRMALQVDFKKIDTAPPLIIYVMDHDVAFEMQNLLGDDDFMGKDDLMGMVVLPLNSGDVNSPVATKPKWYPLQLGKAKNLGEILVSVNVYTSGNPVPKYKILPKTLDTTLELNVLGLRNLQPVLPWMPVRKAFIKFDLNSLQMPGENLLVKNVQTQPGDAGANPNICSTIKFDCKLPIDPLYCPSLSCAVYDYLFRGVSQPLLGTFSINIGQLFHSGKIQLSKPTQQKDDFITFEAETHIPEGDDSVSFEASVVETEHTARGPAGLSNMFGVHGYTQVLGEQFMSLAEARSGNFVVWPKYEMDPNTNVMTEVGMPDPQKYMQIGYDRNPGTDKIQHYRLIIDKELEKTDYIDESPFFMFDIIRGQAITSKGVDESGVKHVGKFKGLIRITQSEELRQKREKVIRIKSDKLQRVETGPDMDDDEDEDFEDISRLLLQKNKCLVRVYVIDCFGLAQKDEKSQSDPYIVIKLGDKKIKDKENYKQDEPNPEYYKLYELDAVLPGASMLQIQVWDNDFIFSDDIIGETVIDLEDRFFSSKWKKIPEKPIETRTLYHKSSKMQQGCIRLWVEIHPCRDVPRSWDLTRRPVEKFQVRLIIWGTYGVEDADVEGTSDLFVRAWINDSEPKETDTHYRCSNGKASFNYRMLFPLSLPAEHCTCNLQIWDRDMVAFTDFIADAVFSFKELATQAWIKKCRLKKYGESDKWMDRFTDKQTEKFRVACRKRTEDGQMEEAGYILLSLELVPEEQATRCKVGEARDAPNIDPFLPPPTGRFEWSYNPLTLISQLCGPEFKAKICCLVCCILCCILAIMILPLILTSMLGTLASSSVNQQFWLEKQSKLLYTI